MRALVSAELRKLATVPSSWILTGAALLLAGALGFANVHLAPHPSHLTWPQLLASVAGPVWFFASLMGVLAAAGEFQHHTIRSSLLAVPRRSRLLLAKLLTVVTYAGGLVALTTAVLAAAGAVTAAVDGVALGGATAAAWWSLLGLPLSAAAVAVVGAAIGMLARSTALAVGALLVWRFVGEGVLPVLLRRPGAASWLPSGAGERLLHATTLGTAVGCAAVLAAYAVVLAAVALRDLDTRDVA